MTICTLAILALMLLVDSSLEETPETSVKKWQTDGCDAFADIVLIIDSSDSRRKDNKKLNTILRFSADLTDTFKLGVDYAQIAAVVYSNTTQKQLDLIQITDHAQLRKAILGMTSFNGSDEAKPYHGLDLIADMFRPDLGGRYNAGKIAVLIMAKASDIPDYTRNSAKRLQDQGVAVLVVAVGKPLWQEPVIVESNTKDVFLVEKLGDLSKVRDRITSRICEGRIKLSNFTTKSPHDLK